MKDKFSIIVCASGGGGNFQALIDAHQHVGYTIQKLIADRDCGALARAERHNIPFALLDKKQLGSSFWDKYLEEIPENIDLVVLAGFMPIVPDFVCKKWEKKMINTHPSLLPKYGGKGMYGVKVQEAVIAAKEEYAGCSVHLVSPEIDGGDILLQRSLKINEGETPWDLGGRIFKIENRLLVEAVELMMERKRNA